jgi:hypothetical protein
MSLLGIDPRREDEFKAFPPLEGEVRTVSSTGGEKGVKSARFDLIPVEALTRLAEHYGRGAQKYDDHQWRKGYEWSKSYAALQRHLTAWWGGEDLDPEFGTSHLAAVAWHAFTLLTFIEIHPDHDDRPGTTRNAEIDWDPEEREFIRYRYQSIFGYSPKMSTDEMLELLHKHDTTIGVTVEYLKAGGEIGHG